MFLIRKHFLAYERVEILVTFFKRRLLGKVHFQLNSFRVESEVFGKKIGSFCYIINKACGSALKMKFYS